MPPKSGAELAVFVEKDRRALAVIRENLRRTRFSDRAEVIAGDAHGYSDGLLGFLDAIARAAGAGLGALTRGQTRRESPVRSPMSMRCS